MTATALYKVDITLQRVQTFIFDVPRLKGMLGANALVGEVLRHDLTALATDAQPVPDAGAPEADPDDPLPNPKVGAGETPTGDDPVALYRKGILVRDGGRFKAVFADESAARAFGQKAEALLNEKLPGVLFEIDVTGLGETPREGGGREARAVEEHLLDLPVLQICQETGREIASEAAAKGTWAAASVKQRLDAGQRFYDGRTRDIIGLMRQQLGLTKDSGWREPEDLADLCAGGYLAIIHADGNRVGARYNMWMQDEKSPDMEPGNELAREAWGERFYHSMRVAVRKSVVAALQSTFAKSGGTRPYEVLMLGGDDLLIACRANRALDFAKNYAEQLTKHDLADGQPLTIGVGIAIAKQSYPLHRLHELAESLAGSAKRLYRAAPDKCSVIDWQVVTQSWFDNVTESRRRADLVQYRVDDTTETLVLSGRPYPILPGQGDSLTNLLAAVEQLDPPAISGDAPSEANPGNGGEHTAEQGAARAPLRALRPAFEAGRLSGEIAFGRLDDAARKTLAGGDGDSPWQHKGEHRYLTRILDIVGLREISRLGKKK